jgi:hypothetical protein
MSTSPSGTVRNIILGRPGNCTREGRGRVQTATRHEPQYAKQTSRIVYQDSIEDTDNHDHAPICMEVLT